MFRSKFAVLMVPVVVLLLSLKSDAESVSNTNLTTILPNTNATTNAATTASTAGTTGNYGNVSTAFSTSPKYVAPRFGGTLRRLVYVTLVLSAVIGFYFLVKFCRAGRRKPRKYGVVKTPGDMEMRPLDSDDDDDDEDVTMFNRKN